MAGELAQITRAATSAGVTWGSVDSSAADGVQTITFAAEIAEGTSSDELSLNVLDSGNISAIAPASGTNIVHYVVTVTDRTGSYAFKANSGALILANAQGSTPETVGTADAQSVLLGASDSGSFINADEYIRGTNGEGNGFNSVLESQWQSGQTSQSLNYYQQGSGSVLHPAVQFKLTRQETTAVQTEPTAVEEEELSGSVPLSVKKVLTGQTLKADQFSFELKDENGNVLQTKKNAQDGTVPFDSLQFTGNDLGEHKYTITEVIPEGAKADSNGKIVVDNIEYDTHTESVTITISLNDEGKLKATVRQSTTELTFTSPATGDSTPIMPYISMLAGAGLALILTKRLMRVYVRK